MSLEIRILYEPACPLYVCQHHHTGDFPFHPFSKQERILIYWDKTLIFFYTVNISISMGLHQYFIQAGNRCHRPASGSHIIYVYVCMYVPVISHISAYSILLQTLSILLVSLEKNHRNKADVQLLFFSCFLEST